MDQFAEQLEELILPHGASSNGMKQEQNFHSCKVPTYCLSCAISAAPAYVSGLAVLSLGQASMNQKGSYESNHNISNR